MKRREECNLGTGLALKISFSLSRLILFQLALRSFSLATAGMNEFFHRQTTSYYPFPYSWKQRAYQSIPSTRKIANLFNILSTNYLRGSLEIVVIGSDIIVHHISKFVSICNLTIGGDIFLVSSVQRFSDLLCQIVYRLTRLKFFQQIILVHINSFRFLFSVYIIKLFFINCKVLPKGSQERKIQRPPYLVKNGFEAPGLKFVGFYKV